MLLKLKQSSLVSRGHFISAANALSLTHLSTHAGTAPHFLSSNFFLFFSSFINSDTEKREEDNHIRPDSGEKTLSGRCCGETWSSHCSPARTKAARRPLWLIQWRQAATVISQNQLKVQCNWGKITVSRSYMKSSPHFHHQTKSHNDLIFSPSYFWVRQQLRLWWVLFLNSYTIRWKLFVSFFFFKDNIFRCRL